MQVQKGVYFGHSSNGVTVRNEKFSSALLRVLFGKLRQSLFYLLLNLLFICQNGELRLLEQEPARPEC